MKATFYALIGMDTIKIEAEGIILETDDGQKIEIWPRKSDGKISLSAKNRLQINPRAANMVYIKDSKEI